MPSRRRSRSAHAAAASSAAPSSEPSTAPGTGASPSIGGAATIPCADDKITALGSTALQPVVDAAAKQYVAACAGSPIDVQGGGSGTGLTQVLQGGADIGNSDVPAESKLKPEEASALVDHVVARQGWLMIASKDVTGVTDLSAGPVARDDRDEEPTWIARHPGRRRLVQFDDG